MITKIAPQYPPEAKDRTFRAWSDKCDRRLGRQCGNIQLISGHPLLAPAAIDAVKQWKYKPYLLNETPVEVETQVHMNFTLMP